MRFSPYEQDYSAYNNGSEKEVLDYFLLRTFETEEVWGLKDQQHWFIRNRDEKLVMPVWPYQQYAEEAATGEWFQYMPAAESLEFFLYDLLEDLKMDEVLIEVMPKPDKPGVLITATQFYNILEGMIESGSYTLDQ